MKKEKIEELINGYKIIQDEQSFKFGTDAIYLAYFAKINKGERIADLCSGSGIIPIMLCAMNYDITIDALEIINEVAETARRSVRMNNLEDKINVITGDIREIKNILPSSSIDVITVNPPYLPVNSGKMSDIPARAAARHEILCNLEDAANAAKWLLRYGGRLYMVHRPERLSDVFVTLHKNGLEPKVLQMLHKDSASPPSLILVEGQKGAAGGLIILPPKFLC